MSPQSGFVRPLDLKCYHRGRALAINYPGSRGIRLLPLSWVSYLALQQTIFIRNLTIMDQRASRGFTRLGLSARETARLSALYVVFPAGAWATRGRVEACNGEARTLTEFQVSFPDEATCAAFLFKQRWPEGFVCPVCHPMIPTPRDFVPEHRRLL